MEPDVITVGCHRLDQGGHRLDEPGQDKLHPLLLLGRLTGPQLLEGGGVVLDEGEVEAWHRVLDSLRDGAEALYRKVGLEPGGGLLGNLGELLKLEGQSIEHVDGFPRKRKCSRKT